MDRNARKRPPLNNELLLKQGCFPCAACEILDQFTHGSTSGLSHVLCSTNPASTATNPHLKVIPSTILSKNQKINKKFPLEIDISVDNVCGKNI